MRTIRELRVMQRWALQQRAAGEIIHFVPTMGALHAGHLELVRQAKRARGRRLPRVVVSIYVNPTQFGPGEDLDRYPRPWAQDQLLVRQAGVSVLFAPTDLYAGDHSTWVEEQELSRDRCGASRPGHFRGVTTVVMKLLQLVQPHRIFMGEKDGQQVEVVERMLRDLHVPVELVRVPTVRDRDGLALSSRNRYLSAEERRVAAGFAARLQQAARRGDGEEWLLQVLQEEERCGGLRVDYVKKVNGRLYAAVWVGKTRLIDNLSCR